ncbi:MAG: radical SAM/SPASM domain-containing protein [Candidatus Methanofastidiosia archaeon]
MMKISRYIRSENVVIRKEYFGGIGFQRDNGITIEFDDETYVLLLLLSKPLSLLQIKGILEQRFNRAFSLKEIKDQIEKFMVHGYIRSLENRKIVQPWSVIQTNKNETCDGFLSAPEVVHLSITSRCNLDCPFCYRENTEDMSTEEIIGFINELSSMRVFQLAIGGGEPLLRDDLSFIIDYCHRKNIVPNLTTNGTLLTNSFIKKISGKVGQVNLSFNDCFDQKGIDNRKKIFLLNKHGIRSGINLLITHMSVSKLEETLSELKELPVQSITILRPKPVRNEEWYKESKLKEGDLELINRSLTKHKKIRVDCSLVCLMRQAPKEILQDSAIYGCVAGIRFCTVDSDGSVIPCSFFHDKRYRAGNITWQDFRQIWTGSKVFKLFREMNKNIKGVCRSCEIKSYCKGCRRIAMETGDFYSGECLCGG